MNNENYTTEELIEQLKEQYPSVKFRAGTVGFAVFYGSHCIPFSYRILQDPNWPVMLDCAVTLLEVQHAGAHQTEQFD